MAEEDRDENLESFGVAGLMGPKGRVFYENIFSSRHVGRVTDLLAARLKKAGFDELRFRALMLFGVFEASRYSGNYEGFDESQTWSEPLTIECGIDDEKIAIGVSYVSHDDQTVNWDGISERLDKIQNEGIGTGADTEDFDYLLAQLQSFSSRIILKRHEASNRVEIVAVLSIGDLAKGKTAGPPARFEFVSLPEVVQDAPSVSEYVELGDTEYSDLLPEDQSSRKKKKEKAGKVLAKKSADKVEKESLQVVSGGDEEDDDEEILVKGLSEEDEEDVVVKGSGKNQNDEVKVGADKKGKEGKTIVSGSEDEIDDEEIVVSGEDESEDEQKTIVKSKKKNKKVEETVVEGEDEEEIEEKTVFGKSKKKKKSVISKIFSGEEDEEDDEDDDEEEEQPKKKKRRKKEKVTVVSGGDYADADEEKIVIEGGSDEEDDEDETLEVKRLSKKKKKKNKKSKSKVEEEPEEFEDDEEEYEYEDEDDEDFDDDEWEYDEGVGEKVGKLFKSIWPFKKKGQNEEEDDEDDDEDDEDEDFDDDDSEEDEVEEVGLDRGVSIQQAARSLANELQAGSLERMIQKAKSEWDDISKNIKDPKTRSFVQGLMGDLVQEKARIHELAAKLSTTVRQKELDFRNKEGRYQQELRQKTDELRQKEYQLQRAKDQTAQALGAVSKIKKGGGGLDEESKYRQRFNQSQRLLELQKRENTTLSRRNNDLQKSLALAQSAAKSSRKGAEDTRALKEKATKAQRQADELKRTNVELLNRISEMKRTSKKSQMSSDEMQKRLEAAMKVAVEKKRENEAALQETARVESERDALKAELEAMQKALDAEKKKAG